MPSNRVYLSISIRIGVIGMPMETMRATSRGTSYPADVGYRDANSASDMAIHSSRIVTTIHPTKYGSWPPP